MKVYPVLLAAVVVLTGCDREQNVRDQATLEGQKQCAPAGGMKYLKAPRAGEWQQETYFEAHCKDGQIVRFSTKQKGP